MEAQESTGVLSQRVNELKASGPVVWDSVETTRSTSSLQRRMQEHVEAVADHESVQIEKAKSGCVPFPHYNHKRLFKSKQVVYLLFLNFLMASVLEISTSFLEVTDITYVLVASGIKLAISLMYPIAGFCGDVYFGRKRMVLFSLPVVIIGFVLWLIFIIINRILLETILEKSNPIFGFVTMLSLLPVYLGIASFKANVLQLGADQLTTASSDNISSFVGWFVITKLSSIILPSLLIYLAHHCSYNYTTPVVVLGISVTTAMCICDWNCIRKHFTFHDNAMTGVTGVANPYKTIRDVCKFARQHKHPVRRSALTYWEDELPSRLDLAKARYGGPFTYEEVENVKTFFQVLPLILMMDFPHITHVVTFHQVDILSTHLTPNLTCGMNLREQFYVHECYSSHILLGSYSSIFSGVIVLLLLYELLLQPCYHRYFTGILRRYIIGAFLVVLAKFSDFLVEFVGHLKEEKAVPCMFRTLCIRNAPDDVLSSLNISIYFLLFPNVIFAVGYGLTEISTIEFILAQTPYSMIGVAIGVHFFMKTIYHIISLCVITVFAYTDTLLASYCGRVYYALNTVIGALGFVVFCVLARRYKYRKRDEPGDDRVYQFAEDYYKH